MPLKKRRSWFLVASIAAYVGLACAKLGSLGGVVCAGLGFGFYWVWWAYDLRARRGGL